MAAPRKRTYIKWLGKLAALAVGLPLLVLGIILIPVPGPGVLTCLLALFILSLAFDWPKPYLLKTKAIVQKIIDDAKQQAKKIEDKEK